MVVGDWRDEYSYDISSDFLVCISVPKFFHTVKMFKPRLFSLPGAATLSRPTVSGLETRGYREFRTADPQQQVFNVKITGVDSTTRIEAFKTVRFQKREGKRCIEWYNASCAREKVIVD